MAAMRATDGPSPEGGTVESTRQRLIDAALDVFADEGYDGARVQEIARRAGLTTGAIYGRFRNKAELLMEAVASGSADELDDLITPEGPGPTAHDLLVGMGRNLMKPKTSEHERTQQTVLIEALVAGRRDADLGAMVRETIAEQGRRLRLTVERARQQGTVAPSVDTDTFVAFGLSLALGTLLYKAVDLPRPDDSSWTALIGRLVGALADEALAAATPAETADPDIDPATDPSTDRGRA